MSFSNDSVSDSELYFPDFTLVRKNTGHTKRRTFPYSDATNTKLDISRQPDENDMIPVTDVDDLLSDFEIAAGTTELTLRKANTFANVKEALELYSTEVTKTYDSKTNLEKHIYCVPVVGYLKNSITSNTKSSNHKSQSNTSDSEMSRKERFIIIDNHKYSCDKVYKPHSGMYIPFVIPNIPEVELSPQMQYFRISKTSFEGNTFTFTLPIPMRISGFAMRAEPFKYNYVHSTAFHCNHKCQKQKHSIRVLSNNPGFIKKFDLSFRSPDTQGKWVEMGKFDGSKSIFSHDLIQFDEILTKEFRITVTDYEGNIEKIRVEPFGKMISSNQIDSSTVTYTLHTPRDGHYVRKYEKRSDFIKGYTGCDCSTCRPHAKAKGVYKQKCKMMYQIMHDNQKDYY